jgi:hypothetical protein
MDGDFDFDGEDDDDMINVINAIIKHAAKILIKSLLSI